MISSLHTQSIMLGMFIFFTLESDKGVVTSPVCDIHGQDIKAQPRPGVCPGG